ncbi:site-specific integrase [Acidiphilium acidophilum]|uniref:tyrosine-type recombinase/integrase n=1 Tax=Acidiphilium acidophilum TaxID=76588 RepID=UPI002E8E7362|nr:site-specific integrase [Acidiphilium acidophilum]
MKFTHRSIETLTCPPGKKDMIAFDDDLSGFGVRVSASGGKTFLIQYRTPSGPRRMPVGKFGALTVEQAKRRAKELLGQIAGGADPVAERAAAEEAKRKADADSHLTVSALLDSWVKQRGAERRSLYVSSVVGTMRRGLLTMLDRPATEMTTRDAVLALDAAKTQIGPIAANRLLSYSRAVWGWAVKRQMLAVNPWAGLDMPSRETSRDRVLDDAELGAVWRAAGKVGWPAGPFVKMLILTGSRRDEVSGMKWAELSADVWTLPGARSKNRAQNSLPLPDAARQVLAELPRMAGSEYFFTTTGSTPISGFSAFKEAIDRAIEADLGFAIPGWRLHDLRRSVATGLQRLGVRLEVTEAILNHQSGTKSGIVGVYQRHHWMDEKRAAMAAWAAHVIAVAEGRAVAGNIVSLRA